MIELTSVVISKKFRCHILWLWRNLTKFYEIMIFVNSVPRYKLDGHWLRRFQINQSVIALHSSLVLHNIVWGSSVCLAHECYFKMVLFVIW
jgi:hypothetical protein